MPEASEAYLLGERVGDRVERIGGAAAAAGEPSSSSPPPPPPKPPKSCRSSWVRGSTCPAPRTTATTQAALRLEARQYQVPRSEFPPNPRPCESLTGERKIARFVADVFAERCGGRALRRRCSYRMVAVPRSRSACPRRPSRGIGTHRTSARWRRRRLTSSSRERRSSNAVSRRSVARGSALAWPALTAGLPTQRESGALHDGGCWLG